MESDLMLATSGVATLPPAYWAVVFFMVGCALGSFLNVVIHRLPRGESLVHPPSHCPHCQYHIPFYLNIPLLTWLMLRGRCRNCGAPIAFRYFAVELLTGLMFLAIWARYGPGLVLPSVLGVFACGLIAASFIDLEHYIIPDEITIGGTVAGIVASLVVPQLHGKTYGPDGVVQGVLGAAVGGGVIYAVVRLGKMAFGRQKLALPANTRVIFAEEGIHLPDGLIPYDELFYRKSDAILLKAATVELIDRCYRDVEVRLKPGVLRIGTDEFSPDQVPHMEVVTSQIVVPREAMGFGDVKFMAAIGAFLGWQATLFSLFASSLLGAVAGVTLVVLKRHNRSNPIPYGPYIAMAAVVWMFCGKEVLHWWLGR